VPFTPDTKDIKINEVNWEKEKLNGSKVIATNEDPFLDW
jgi:hypothetical protein